MEIGISIANSRNKNEDPVRIVRETVSGIDIFNGKVEEINEEEAEGFYFTKVKLSGLGKDKDNSCELIVKNETMTCWKNGELQVVFPDLLCLLDPKTGRGIMSTELKKNLELKLVAISCHERLREALKHPNGKIAFSSKRYGQNIEYVPLEELHQ